MKLRKQLQEMGVESLPGAPFDWKTSLVEERLVLFEDAFKLNKPVGIFIPADRFDSIDETITSHFKGNHFSFIP